MNKSSKHGPQYPAQGGAKIQGEPTISVAAQGTEGSLATDVPGQDAVTRGILASTATRDQNTITSVAPVGHLGATCQQAGLTKPTWRRKKKKQAADSSAAASSSAITSSIHTSAAGSPDEVGTCESFFFRSNRISNRIGRLIRFRIEFSNRFGRCNQITVVYTLHLQRIFNPSVFVTNESDVRTTELRTENLFISIQS